jgi:hypothetical protein
MAEKFERQVDPDGVLDPDDRRKRAEAARAAWMAGVRAKGQKARREKAARLAAELERKKAAGGDTREVSAA